VGTFFKNKFSSSIATAISKNSMPSCFVPGCRAGYGHDKHSSEKKHYFRLPRDQNLFCKWMKAIPRQDLPLTEKRSVCDLHFSEDFIIKCDKFNIQGKTIELPRKNWRLQPDAIPHTFPNLPSFFTSNKTQKQKSPTKRDISSNVHQKIRE
jgi:hypothetical protein